VGVKIPNPSRILVLFNKVVNFIVHLLIPVIIIALIIGIARVFLDLRVIFQGESISKAYHLLIIDILSMFVVIELLRSIIEYFEAHRIKITLISEAAFVFILREIMIGVYNHTIQALEIASLVLLLLVVGGIRPLAIRYSPAEHGEPPNRETR